MSKGVIIAIIIVGIVMLALIILKQFWEQSRHEALDGELYERYCARFLEENGYEDVEITKRSRDYGIDILAVKDGVTFGIQCKSYDAPVGISAVQQAYAGKDYYDRMVGVVMTNSTYTEPAKEMAHKLKIILWEYDV